MLSIRIVGLIAAVLSAISNARPLGRQAANVQVDPNDTPSPLFGAVPTSLLGAEANEWNETTLIQLAVNMEQLEIAYLDKIMEIYGPSDFAASGYEPWVRNRLVQMQSNDRAHLQYLVENLTKSNATVPQSCHYSLADRTVPLDLHIALIALSGVEEAVTGAYLGITEYFESRQNPIPLFAVEEARHQTWVLAAVLKEEPWSGPWGALSTPDQTTLVLSLFYDSCPATNPQLPSPPWPGARLGGKQPQPPDYNGPAGASIQVNYTGVEGKQPGETWFNIQSGLGVEVVPIGANGSFTVPENIQGYGFGMVVSTNATQYTNDQVIAGPLGFHCSFNSTVANPGLPPILA